MGTVSVDVKYNVSRQSDMSRVRWRSVWDKEERKWVLLHAEQIVSGVLGTRCEHRALRLTERMLGFTKGRPEWTPQVGIFFF